MSVFVGAEGFQLEKQFVVKELYLLAAEGPDHRHFFFKAPLMHLSMAHRRTIRYCTRYIHELSWSEGDVPYSCVYPILKKMENMVLYCYGNATANFLRAVLPTSVVVDTQAEGYQMPHVIPDKPCFCQHNTRHCAAAKAHAIRAHVLGGDLGVEVTEIE